MRSTWNPQPADLDAYVEHIEYEIRMLLQQFGWLEAHWDDVQAGSRTDLGADGQALLESALGHLRVLDDFLGSPKQSQAFVPGDRDDVYARHWDPTWQPRAFLTSSQRDRINAHLAHLTARRRANRRDVQPNEIEDFVERCCERLEEFFAHIPPARLSAFRGTTPGEDAPKRVDDFLHHRTARDWAV